MDGRLLGLGLGEECLLSLNWIAFLYVFSLPLSFWGFWGIIVEGVFAVVGLVLLVMGIARQGPMKKSWAYGFMVASLILGVYASVLFDLIASPIRYQENLSFCQDSTVAPSRCAAAMASVWLGLIFTPNLVALGATFLFSLGWVAKSRTGFPDTSSSPR